MGDHDVQAAMNFNRKWGLIRMVATGCGTEIVSSA